MGKHTSPKRASKFTIEIELGNEAMLTEDSEMTIKATHYVSGSTSDVRGPCGHRHRTPAGAAICALRDQRACACVGGYSDRLGIYGSDGTSYSAGTYEDAVSGKEFACAYDDDGEVVS